MAGGLSSAKRRALVKKQLRDKDGKWIDMGGSVKFMFKGASKVGKLFDVEGDYGIVETSAPVSGKTFTVKVHRTGLTAVKAKASLDPDHTPASVKSSDGPPSTAGWKKISGPKGSNPGGIFEAPDGSRYYVKQSKSDNHARNEVLASELYSEAGVPTVEMFLVDVGDGKLGTASKILPDSKPDLATHLSDKSYMSKLREGFAVDAWLANWDVAGLSLDNVITDKDGNPVRVDPGGSLLFRAQGTKKGSAFGDTVGEWTSLRDGSNPQSKKLFGKMTNDELKLSASRVTDISDADIDKAVDSVGFDTKTGDQLKMRLKKRRDDIGAKSAALESSTAAQDKAKAKLDKGKLPSSSDQAKADAEAKGVDTTASDFEKIKGTAPQLAPGVVGYDSEGQKYVSTPDGDPIYVGSTVKSKTDGLEGTVKTIEGNGHYVKVVDSEGKVKGRKISTLSVVKSDTDAPKTDAAPDAAKKTPLVDELHKGDLINKTSELDELPENSVIKWSFPGVPPYVYVKTDKGWTATDSDGDLSPVPHHTAEDASVFAHAAHNDQLTYEGPADKLSKTDLQSLDVPASRKTHAVQDAPIDTASSPAPDIEELAVGDKPKSIEQLDAMPDDSQIEMNGETYVKFAGDDWKNEEGYFVLSNDFAEGIDAGEVTVTHVPTVDEDDDVDVAAPETPTGPSIPDKNGSPITVGSQVTHPTKGYTGTVTKIESNGEYVKVKVEQTGKTHGLKASQLESDGSVAPVDATPSTPSSAPKTQKTPKASIAKNEPFAGAEASKYNEDRVAMPALASNAPEIDKSNPLYGAPEPKQPTLADTPPGTYVSDEWVESVKARYLANPKKAKDSLEQSSNWHRVNAVVESGDKPALDHLLAAKYIDQPMYDDALKQINARQATIDDVTDSNSKLLSEYAKVHGDWAAANGMLQTSTSYSGMPAVSADPFWGGDSDWSKAHVGTPSAEKVFDAVKQHNSTATHGASILTDAAAIEDMDVRVRRIKVKNGSKTEEKIDLQFKLTSRAGDDLQAKLKADKSLASTFGETRLDRATRDSDGLLTYNPSTPGYKGTGVTYTLSDTPAGTEVVFRRSAHKTDVTNGSLHNTVQVRMPSDATPEDMNEVFARLGITPAPASEGDLRVYAENKLISVFGGHTDVRSNFSGAQRQEALDAIKKKFDVTPDDLVMTHDSNGRAKFFLTDEKRDSIIESKKISGFVHRISSATPDTVVSMITGDNPGLNATLVRWTEGIGGNGMSSSKDMTTGGADYVFTKVLHGSAGSKVASEYSGAVVIHPKAAMRRVDLYGNDHDNFGKHKAKADVYDLLSGDPYEIMFKQSVPLADIWYFNLPQARRQEVIARLKAAGVTKVNGIPVDQFIISPGMPTPSVDEARWSTVPAAAAAPAV